MAMTTDHFEEVTDIQSEADVRRFFDYLLNVEHLNFHPDTPFDDYINEDGARAFDDERAAALDNLMNQAFDVAGERVYEIGVEAFQIYSNQQA